MVAPTISTVVQQMKGVVTKQIGFSICQELFHDHIIRGEKDYKRFGNTLKAFLKSGEKIVYKLNNLIGDIYDLQNRQFYHMRFCDNVGATIGRPQEVKLSFCFILNTIYL